MFNWLRKFFSNNSNEPKHELSKEIIHQYSSEYDNSKKSKIIEEYKLQFSSNYWIDHFKTNNLGTNLKIKYNSFLNNANESIKIFILLVEKIWKQAFLAILLVIGFFCLWEFIKQYIIFSWIINYIPFISKIGNNLDAYRDFLTTLAQISGIFLGLYFTAVSVVISTAYTQVPKSVLKILLDEKIGNVYIKIVALLGAVSILMLLLVIYGESPGFLNLILISILGILSILSFIQLGKRLFYFFDPIHLNEAPYNEIKRLIKLPTVYNDNWEKVQYQADYQKKTEIQLNIYHDILDVTKDKSHLKGDSQRILAARSLELLKKYIKEKSSIPTESNWFRLNPKFSNLLIVDVMNYSKVDIATKTKTLVPPEPIIDNYWFEKKIEDIVVDSLESLLENGSLNDVLALSNNINDTLKQISFDLAIKESLMLYRSLNAVIYNKLINNNNFDSNDDNYSLIIGLIDYYGVWLINILLGFHNKLETINDEVFSDVIKNIEWNKSNTIYGHQMPVDVTKQLEYLQKRLLFEFKVEGDIITPFWYQNQLAAFGFVKFICSVSHQFIQEIERVYKLQLDELIKNEKYYFLGPFIQRGLETCEKIQIKEIKIYYENISKLRKINDIHWPEKDWKELEAGINRIKKHLLITLSKTIIEIEKIPLTGDIPDYFGQLYYYIGEECYNSFINGDESLFNDLFPSFFNSCFLTS